MTIQQLIDALARLVEEDPWRAGMSVTFGPDFMPIEGGLIGRRHGLVVLNLAPVPLDKVGGF
ncbi:hypothetical protein [Sphingomonas abietis]|uniref:Uncharacterized protein n=1 Tax=Sphingomonas abietis TaxID=3012344 RepID=A0ABY7NVL3_9SPHN|nr:hypothetical protein [Sphingomonas abietis]WBO24466.1 hypothetical protein PBT88_10365 [Sphingomonas abietis]